MNQTHRATLQWRFAQISAVVQKMILANAEYMVLCGIVWPQLAIGISRIGLCNQCDQMME